MSEISSDKKREKYFVFCGLAKDWFAMDLQLNPALEKDSSEVPLILLNYPRSDGRAIFADLLFSDITQNPLYMLLDSDVWFQFRVSQRKILKYKSRPQWADFWVLLWLGVGEKPEGMQIYAMMGIWMCRVKDLIRLADSGEAFFDPKNKIYCFDVRWFHQLKYVLPAKEKIFHESTEQLENPGPDPE